MDIKGRSSVLIIPRSLRVKVANICFEPYCLQYECKPHGIRRLIIWTTKGKKVALGATTVVFANVYLTLALGLKYKPGNKHFKTAYKNDHQTQFTKLVTSAEMVLHAMATKKLQLGALCYIYFLCYINKDHNNIKEKKLNSLGLSPCA